MLAPALAKRIAGGFGIGRGVSSSFVSVSRTKKRHRRRSIILVCNTLDDRASVRISPETEQLTGSSPDTARCAGDEDVLVEESVGGEDGAHDVGCKVCRI